MDLRDQERKERWNRMIRKEEQEKNSLRSMLVGTIAVAGLIGIVMGGMCYSNCSANKYDPVQQCIEQHYRSFEYKVTPEQHKYIERACGKYKQSGS